MKDWINQAYARAVVETEANQLVATMTTTANVSSYTLPAGVSRIKQMTAQQAGTSGYTVPLRLTSMQQILGMRQNTGTSPVTGSITHYALNGINDFEVYPTPSGVDTINIFYVALPTALSANGDLPILPEPYASKVLEYGALVEAADFVKDPFGYLAYAQTFDEWMMRLRVHLNRRRGAQTEQFQLVPAGSFPPHDPSTDVR